MRTVSGRLTLLFVLLSAVLLAVFSGSLYLWLGEAQERDLQRELATQSRIFQERFIEEHEEVRRGVHSNLTEEIDQLLEASGGRAEVRLPDGRQVYASPGGGAGLRGWRVKDYAFEGRTGEPFQARLAIAEEPFLEPLRQLRLYLATFTPFVLAATGLLGMLFVRRALAPVEEIRRQAERISRSNVMDRVPLPSLRGEFRDLARTFNEMLDRLEKGMQDLQNFAADAAHELRTPLATLRAEIETAVREPRSAAEIQDLLGSQAEEVSRMQRIVTDLFMLAKLDMRQYALQKERVELRPLLEEARETLQAAADPRAIVITLEGADAQVAGDPVALRRVFMNLIENAVKYNREGGRVAIRLQPEGERVRVIVSDNGPGIPAEALPQLFRRFYRVDKARSRESGGAGLGLAICRSFIEAHEGGISAASEPGRGSTFTVDLPRLSA